jgi:hypothetical protein
VGTGGAGLAGRVGIDAEYWLTDNIGIGAQLGYQATTTFPELFSTYNGDGYTASDQRVSLAPAIAYQVKDRVGSPIITLAGGYAWGHRNSSSFCDSADLYPCMPSSSSRDTSGLFGSLAATWMFHLGHPQPGFVAAALGPVARLDAWTFGDRWEAGLTFDSWGASLTVGLAVGFEVARAGAP